MHVAINALFLEPPMGGLETYVRELSVALTATTERPRVTVLVGANGYESVRQQPWTEAVTLKPLLHLGKPGRRAISELGPVGPLADRLGADIIHSVAMIGPLASRARRVVTVPDTIWISHPDRDHAATQRLWRTVVPLVVRRAQRVITIAHTSSVDVERHLGVPAYKVDVTPLGGGERPMAGTTVTPLPQGELRARLGLGDGPIILNVGQKGGHRNLRLLVAALAIVRCDFPDAQLVLPGTPHPVAEQRLREEAIRAGVGAAIHMPGYVDADTLEGLYANASAFVMPSLLEGFGLPALEALARGVPVACSRGTTPAEIVGPAGLKFDATSVEEMAATIGRLLGDGALSARLRAAGPQRARTFTWGRCARLTIDSYRRALAA